MMKGSFGAWLALLVSSLSLPALAAPAEILAFTPGPAAGVVWSPALPALPEELESKNKSCRDFALSARLAARASSPGLAKSVGLLQDGAWSGPGIEPRPVFLFFSSRIALYHLTRVYLI